MTDQVIPRYLSSIPYLKTLQIRYPLKVQNFMEVTKKIWSLYTLTYFKILATAVKTQIQGPGARNRMFEHGFLEHIKIPQWIQGIRAWLYIYA